MKTTRRGLLGLFGAGAAAAVVKPAAEKAKPDPRLVKMIEPAPREVMRLDASGQLGIGTVNPSANLGMSEHYPTARIDVDEG